MTNCGYYLRVNGTWLPLDGVQSGVGIEQGRASSEMISVGGVRHVQYSESQARTWSLDFGHASPSAVAAVELAAAGRSGEVWLWDESAARQNIFPEAVFGELAHEVVQVGDLALRSVTSQGATPPPPSTVDRAAWIGIQSSDNTSGFAIIAASSDILARFAVPATPAGMVLASAKLRLAPWNFATGGGFEVFTTTGAWSEGVSPIPGIWAASRAGSLIGAGAMPTATAVDVDVSGVGGFAGGFLNLRVARSAGSSLTVTMGGAQLILAYTPVGAKPDIEFDIPIRNIPLRLSFTTDAAASTPVAFLSVAGGGEIPLEATAGSGLRRCVIDFPGSGAAVDTHWRIPDGGYKLAGLTLTSLTTNDGYCMPQNACVKVAVDDPTLSLDSLYPGQQGEGRRTVLIREVG